jgi:type I restriction enzyme, S subunit
MTSRARPLAELCSIKQGRYLAPNEMSDSMSASMPVPVIGGNGVLGFTNRPSNSRNVVLITCRGSRCGLLQWVEAPVWVSNNAIACDTGTDLGNQLLRYLLGTTNFQDVTTGSAQPQITIGHLSAKQFEVPPTESWAGIVHLLSTIDDRIALLRETNATLEAIAQALFKSWFVDFDPVRAKQQGLAPAGMDEATAALFPDSFEESALGLLPRGWATGTVDSLMELAYGKALKATDRVAGEVPVYGSGGITGHHNEALIFGPSVVVGRKGTVGSLYWEDRPFFPIDTVFYVKAKVPMTYCFYQLRRLGLEKMNTDGAVPGLNRSNVYHLTVVVPPREVLLAFDVIVRALRDRIFVNVMQAQTLATLRDTLLPRLISGQLRLPQPVPATLETTPA